MSSDFYGVDFKSLPPQEDWDKYEGLLWGTELPNNHGIMYKLPPKARNVIKKIVEERDLYVDTYFSFIRNIRLEDKRFGMLFFHKNAMSVIFREDWDFDGLDYPVIYQIHHGKKNTVSLQMLNMKYLSGIINYFNVMLHEGVEANLNKEHTEKSYIYTLSPDSLGDHISKVYEKALKNVDDRYIDYINNYVMDVGSWYSKMIHDPLSEGSKVSYINFILENVRKTYSFNWYIPDHGVAKYVIAKEKDNSFLIMCPTVVFSNNPEVIRQSTNVELCKKFLCFWSKEGECRYSNREGIEDIFINQISCPMMRRYDNDKDIILSARQRMLKSCKYQCSGLIHRSSRPSNCEPFYLYKGGEKLPGKYYSGKSRDVKNTKATEICLPYEVIFDGEPPEIRKKGGDTSGWFQVIYSVPPGTEKKYKHLNIGVGDTGNVFASKVVERGYGSGFDIRMGPVAMMIISYYGE